jgi:hypothetical protein
MQGVGVHLASYEVGPKRVLSSGTIPPIPHSENIFSFFLSPFSCPMHITSVHLHHHNNIICFMDVILVGGGGGPHVPRTIATVRTSCIPDKLRTHQKVCTRIARRISKMWSITIRHDAP